MVKRRNGEEMVGDGRRGWRNGGSVAAARGENVRKAAENHRK